MVSTSIDHGDHDDEVLRLTSNASQVGRTGAKNQKRVFPTVRICFFPTQ